MGSELRGGSCLEIVAENIVCIMLPRKTMVTEPKKVGKDRSVSNTETTGMKRWARERDSDQRQKRKTSLTTLKEEASGSEST